MKAKTNRWLLITITLCMAVAFIAPASSAEVKTMQVECDELGDITYFWVPAGAPVLLDQVKIYNLTGHPITNVKYNGTLKATTIATGTTSGILGVVATGDVLDFCAKCDDPSEEGSGCVVITIETESGTVNILYGCADCMRQVPSLTNWGMLALLVLLVLSAVIVIRKRQRGSVPA